MGSRSAFQIVSKYGIRYRTSLLWVRYVNPKVIRAHKHGDNDTNNAVIDQNAGVGIAVSYAISRKLGNAVTRNRIKRRLRAAFSQSRELSEGYYLVGVHNVRIAKADFSTICENIDILAKKIRGSEQ